MNDFRKYLMDVCEKYSDCKNCPFWEQVEGQTGISYRICDLTSEALGIIEELEDEVHRNNKQE